VAVGVEVRAVRISTLPILVAVAKALGFTVATVLATAKARVVKSVSFIVDEIVQLKVFGEFGSFLLLKIINFFPFVIFCGL
jgi:hypothetical protein